MFTKTKTSPKLFGLIKLGAKLVFFHFFNTIIHYQLSIFQLY